MFAARRYNSHDERMYYESVNMPFKKRYESLEKPQKEIKKTYKLRRRPRAPLRYDEEFLKQGPLEFHNERSAGDLEWRIAERIEKSSSAAKHTPPRPSWTMKPVSACRESHHGKLQWETLCTFLESLHEYYNDNLIDQSFYEYNDYQKRMEFIVARFKWFVRHWDPSLREDRAYLRRLLKLPNGLEMYHKLCVMVNVCSNINDFRHLTVGNKFNLP